MYRYCLHSAWTKAPVMELISKKALLFAATAACLTLVSSTVSAKQAAAGSQLFDKLQALFSKHYPQALIERTDKTFTAKFRAKSFMIRLPLKTGELQPARAIEGPAEGGIVCSVEIAPGRWQGAAMVPQSFDHQHFTSLLMAPYSTKSNSHLVAHLDYPLGTPAKFLLDYARTINSFGDKSR
jgi:hypothetical protein